MLFYAVLAVLALCEALDCITTLKAFRLNGGESNFLMEPLIKLFGPIPVMVVTKIGYLALLAAFFPPTYWYLLLAVVAGYGLVLRNNLRVIKNLEQAA